MESAVCITRSHWAWSKQDLSILVSNQYVVGGT